MYSCFIYLKPVYSQLYPLHHWDSTLSTLRYCEVTPALGPTRTRVRHQKAVISDPERNYFGFPAWVNAAAVASRSAVFADQVCMEIHTFEYDSYMRLI